MTLQTTLISDIATMHAEKITSISNVGGILTINMTSKLGDDISLIFGGNRVNIRKNGVQVRSLDVTSIPEIGDKALAIISEAEKYINNLI